MQRIFSAILLAVVGVFMSQAHAAWDINKFKMHQDKGCVIDKKGNYAYWFCGKPNTQWCCNGLCRVAGQYKHEMKQSEVLTMDLLQAGEPDINDDSLDGKYICCHKNFKVSDISDNGSAPSYDENYYKKDASIGTNQGEFRLASGGTTKKLNVDGKTCSQEYDACGNKVGECVALCGNDDEIEINGKCQKKCLPGEAYESANSFVCVSCPTGPKQKIVTSSAGYQYCLQCDSNSFIKGNACQDKNEFTKYTSQQMVACWKCAFSNDTLSGCLNETSGSGRDSYISKNCKVTGY